MPNKQTDDAHLVDLLKGGVGLVRRHVLEAVKDIDLEEVQKVGEGDVGGATVVVQPLLSLLDAQAGGDVVSQYL